MNLRGLKLNSISVGEYWSILGDEDTTDEQILELSLIDRSDGGFNVQLVPNPELVDVAEEDLAEESFRSIGNALFRWRRHRQFNRRRKDEPELPVLVSEGDSWFHFPLFISETIDQLGSEYLIWSVGEAGDTAANMLLSEQEKNKTEYLLALRKQKDLARAFLLSAAGNDILGMDPETDESALFGLLRDFDPEMNDDPCKAIDEEQLHERLAFLRSAYQSAISAIRNEPGFEQLPIITHGYDYPFPFPWGDQDHRDPLWAKSDEWLGRPFADRNFPATPFRRQVLTFMVDALYDVLNDLAGESASTNVWVVDCRGAMPELTDWADEIHGTSAGFAKVAQRFSTTLTQAIGD